MSTTTSKFGLFKYNTTTDSNVAFSINTALNNNWDILDAQCMKKVNNIGSTVKPVYVNSSGEFAELSATVGDINKPTYLNAGKVTALTASIGSSTKPVYLNTGEVSALSNTIGTSVKPVYLNGGNIAALSNTVGSGSKPVYLSSGEFKTLSATVGSSIKPIYLNAGAITACSSNMVTASLSKNANGYIKFSSDFLLQWGTSSHSGASEATITMPTAYSSTYRINGTDTVTMSTHIITITIVSLTQFSMYYSTSAHWMTVGW